MPSYKISLEADADLQDIAAYGIETWGLNAALEFRDGLKLCFEHIAAQPMQYQAVDHIKAGYRRCVYRKGRGRTAIYYRIIEGTVEIMAVVQRQDMSGHSRP